MSPARRTWTCWPPSPGRSLLATCYAEATAAGYLWHEFGDVNLLLP